MSDTSQGDGWWQASDGKWYAPEQHQDVASEPPTETPAATASEAPTEAIPASPAAVPADATTAMPATPAPTAPATPPPAAPTPPPTPAASGGGGGGKGKIIGAIVAVIALAAAAFGVLALTGDDEASAGEVILEPIGQPGPAPFTSPVASVDAKVQKWATEGPPANLAPATSAGPADYQEVDGGVPGVFGGSLNESACDVGQLTQFLADDADKAAAWADVHQIDQSDIAGFIDGLTATNLSIDTRVVNNAFADGEIDPREAVLERGTAVLNDARGVPRVNCYSGNPLTPPSVQDGEEFSGTQWPAFSQTNIIIINQASDDLSALDLIDLESGQLFSRPVGTNGENDGGNEPVDAPAQTDRPDDGVIEFDTLIEDRLEDGRNEARYTFEVPDGAVLTFTAENERDSVAGLRFIFSTSQRRFVDVNLSPGDDDEARVVIDDDGGDDFELAVTGGPAAFSFTMALDSQDDAGSGVDAGSDLAGSLPVSAGTIAGQMGDIDDADVYEIDLVPGTDLLISATNDRASEGGFRAIGAIDGDRVFDNNVVPGSDESGATLLSGLDEGTLVLTLSSGATVAYSIEVAFVAQTDTDADGDAGDDLAGATPVTDASTISGEVGQRDPGDFYILPAVAAGTFEISSDASSDVGIRVILEDDSGRRVVDVNLPPGTTETRTFVDVDTSELRLKITGGRAAYSGGIS